jgi:outer membrane protein OmpA-like peptidoglycan-associated protein
MGRTTFGKAASWMVVLGMALAGGEAFAGEEARLGLQLQALVSGNDQPAILLAPGEGVANVKVRLERAQAASPGSSPASAQAPVTNLSSGAIAAGSRKTLSVTQPFGTFEYTAHFDAKFTNGEASAFDMKFSLTRVDKLQLELSPENVNLDARTLSFRINNPGKVATIELYGKSGTKLATVEKSLAGTPGGTAVSMSWGAPAEELLYLDVKVTDVAGFWKGVRLTPFSVNIPHEEVEFESGKFDIRGDQEPKLKKTLSLIKDALDQHGKLIELRLYVAGYTDTVGSKDSNRILSQNRARSIAAWFSRNGIKVPIFYQGFGEDVLAKPTPDETAEQANRRALYILSSQTPASSTNLPKSSWSRL